MNKIGQIVAHFSDENDIINFGVVTNCELRDDEEWIEVKWTNREFNPDKIINSQDVWLPNGAVDVIEPFGLISDLHLAMIEQAKACFLQNEDK